MGKKCRKWHVCCAVLHYILYTEFSKLWDFHRLFGSKNSPTTGIVHTIRHIYRSMWPAREAKPRFGVALECDSHDCKTHLYSLNCMVKHFNSHPVLHPYFNSLDLMQFPPAVLFVWNPLSGPCENVSQDKSPVLLIFYFCFVSLP